METVLEKAIQEPDKSQVDPGKAVVLCVDDELLHLSALSTALSGFCEVLCAGNAEEAEAMLVERVPDIILLDNGLPGVSGFELCRRIRENRAFDSTRIIMVSAYNQVQDRLRAYELGADDYVPKPYAVAEIAAKIRVSHRIIATERWLTGNKQALEHLLSESIQELKKKFTIDTETGFPNGLRFSVDIRQPPVEKTVILLNINSFGRINEAFGYNCANRILAMVAERLRKTAEACGYPIYRMRGADFALLISDPGLTSSRVAAFIAGIQDDFCRNCVQFEEFEIRITFNAGIALNETDEHLKKASLALTYSRNYGPGQHAIFSQHTVARDKYEENISWGKIVKKAIAENGVIPYFQGIYSNTSGGIEKYECLVRIKDGPELYLPRQFLPAASRLGLMTSVTREMLSCCFAYFASFPRDIEFSVNISEDDLLDVDFLGYVERALVRHDIRPGRVIFEIIETASISDKRALRNLDGLKRTGCQLALDDFGTENSNFARILSLKADFIKIDGRFVSDMHRSRESFIVVKTITDFAHSIGAKAVAEFVHCPEIQAKLIEIGADYSQGYLIHHPTAEIFS